LAEPEWHGISCEKEFLRNGICDGGGFDDPGSHQDTKRDMKAPVILLLLAALSAFAADPIMPAERQTVWQGNVGIPGGIPVYPNGINVRNPPYNAYGDGIHNDTLAIQAAINNAANFTAVYLPAGTYLITNTLSIPTGYPSKYPSIAIRGDGPGLTTIALTNPNPAYMVGDVIYIRSGTGLNPPVSILGGLTQGSTSITLASATGLHPGSLLSITELNDTNFVSVDTYTTNSVVPSGAAYGAALTSGGYAGYGSFTLPVIAGHEYLFYPGASTDFRLVNGSQVLQGSSADFVAQSTNIVFYGTPKAVVHSDVQVGWPCSYCGENGQRVLQQFVRVTSVSGNVVGVNPPLLWNYNPALAPTAQYCWGMITRCGVENLTITRYNGQATSGGYNIDMANAAWCWVTNVESSWSQGAHIRLNYAFQCQVSHCYIHNAWSYQSGQGYGVWIFEHNSNHLIEDTIFQNIRHSMVTEGGGAASVFGYNFSTNVIAGEDPTTFLSGDQLQHGAHAWFILYEGNTSASIRGDYAHGSSSHITYFRENIYGKSYIPANTKDALAYLHLQSFRGSWVTNQGGFDGVDFETYNYSNSVIGCVFSPNLAAAAAQCAHPLIYQTSPTTSILPNSAVIVRAGYIQQGDAGVSKNPTVLASTYWHGNWDPYNNAVVWDPSNPDHNIPQSLYLTNKPSWWGNALRWPPAGSDLTPMTSPIPAEQRLGQIMNPLLPPTNLRVVGGS
jgi:hypothetical protein